MTKRFFIVSFLLSYTAAAMAQGLTGTWNGTIEMNTIPLKIVFHFKDKGSTMDSPSQGASGIPIDVTYHGKDSVSLTCQPVNVSYNGKLHDGVIKGAFKQNGHNLRLDLVKGNIKYKRPQEPRPPLPYYGEEVTFKNPHDGTEIAGTLTLPKNYNEKTPVVIMVSGSGIQNRDEEIAHHKPFFVISDYLARHGIGALRYDDRSAGLSKGDASKATTETFAQDAEAAVKYIKEKQHFNNVGILGHSEGGTIGIMLGKKNIVKFVVSLAGPAIQGKDLLVKQSQTLLNRQKAPEVIITKYGRVLNKVYSMRIDGEQFNDPDAKIAEISTALNTSIPPFMQTRIKDIMKSWTPWIDFFIKYDPANDIKDIKVPVLAMYGELDTQVSSQENMLAMTQNLPENPLSQVRSFPELNHLFQHCKTGSIFEYGDIEETISPEILQKIATWIKSVK